MLEEAGRRLEHQPLDPGTLGVSVTAVSGRTMSVRGVGYRPAQREARAERSVALSVGSAHVARVAEGVAAGLGPHGEPVGLAADGDGGQLSGRRVEDVDDLSYRPLSQTGVRSALTLPMLGPPPPGIGQFATTARLEKSMTLTRPWPCGPIPRRLGNPGWSGRAWSRRGWDRGRAARPGGHEGDDGEGRPGRGG